MGRAAWVVFATWALGAARVTGDIYTINNALTRDEVGKGRVTGGIRGRGFLVVLSLCQFPFLICVGVSGV